MKAMKRATWLALALLAYAAPASAVDFFGYFRDGAMGNSKGGGQACFKTPGQDYKLRLGNECDNYGEWGLQQTVYKDKNGVEFTYGLMFNYDQGLGINPGTSVAFGVQQNYVKAKFPQLAGATFWAGKQYYERENIDMIDWFYLNLSDTGIGVEDVDTGFGKLSFSVFGVAGATNWAYGTGEDKVTTSTPERMYWRPDVRMQGIPVNPGGTLEIDANVLIASKHKDATEIDNEGTAGFFLTAEHHQNGILGGNNTFLVQFANSIAAPMGGGVPSFGYLGIGNSNDKNNMQFRVIDQLLLQPSNQFQILVGGVYQMKKFGDALDDGSDLKVNSLGVFTRPVFYVNDYFKLQGDLGYTANKADHGGKNLNLVKATFAPTLTPAVGEGGGFFVRPELRLYVTYASWNADANDAGVAGGNFGTDKNGVTYGFQAEGWF